MTERKAALIGVISGVIVTLTTLGGAALGYLANRYIEGDALTIAISSDISSKIWLFNNLCEKHGENDFFDLFPLPGNSNSTVVKSEVRDRDFRKENHLSVYDKAVEKLGYLKASFFVIGGQDQRTKFVEQVVQFYDKFKLSRDYFGLLIAMDKCISQQAAPYKCDPNSVILIRKDIRILLHEAIKVGKAAIGSAAGPSGEESLCRVDDKAAVTAAPPPPQ
jgi:hypothetical protein